MTIWAVYLPSSLVVFALGGGWVVGPCSRPAAGKGVLNELEGGTRWGY